MNPTRTTQTHSEKNGRTIDSTSTQRLGPDGRYIPYSQTEKETVKVDVNTVRTIERTFGTGPEGQRTLIQQTQEESRSLPGGVKKIERTTSNPDGDGRLQVIRRELVDSKQVSAGARETNTTVYSADGNGGISAAVQVHERETRGSDGTVQFSKSTELTDGSGHWNVSEVRQGTIKPDGSQGTTKEETVLRPDGSGKLATVERTVSKQSGGNDGQDVTETYSTNVPGQAGTEGLQLVQRERVARRSGSGGAQNTVREVETVNAGNAGDGLRLSQQAIDIVRPNGQSSAEQNRTVVTFGPDGQVNTTLVDFGKTNNPATVNVNTQNASSPPAATKK